MMILCPLPFHFSLFLLSVTVLSHIRSISNYKTVAGDIILINSNNNLQLRSVAHFRPIYVIL
jgi:hypothetical protein